MRTRDAHFPLFDALRAIAALTVFTLHCVYQPARDSGEIHWWYPLGVHLDIGVPIFFAISGFLLYRPFVTARRRGRPLSIRAYARRRVLRIVPGYWVALFVIVLWFDLGSVNTVGEALWFGLFLQIYDADTSLKAIGQAWTLNVEVTYYMFLPLLALAVARWQGRGRGSGWRGEVIVLAGVFAAGVGWKVLALSQTDFAAERSLLWLLPMPTWFDQFAVGMFLAVASVWMRERGDEGVGRVLGFLGRHPGIPWGLAFLCWLTVVYGVGPNGIDWYLSDREYMARHLLYTAAVFLLLVPGVFSTPKSGLIGRLLAFKPLAYIGTVSYTFYLFHFAVILQALTWFSVPESALEWIAWYAGCLGASVAIATVGYFCVEKPFMNLKNREPRRRESRELDAAQAQAAP